MPDKDDKPWDARLVEWLARDAAVARSTSKRKMTRGEWIAAAIFLAVYFTVLLATNARWWVFAAMIVAYSAGRWAVRRRPRA